MSLLLGLKNTATQAVPTGSSIAFNGAYRKYCKKNCGMSTFSYTLSVSPCGVNVVTLP